MEFSGYAQYHYPIANIYPIDSNILHCHLIGQEETNRLSSVIQSGSDESHVLVTGILRFAQDDKRVLEQVSLPSITIL